MTDTNMISSATGAPIDSEEVLLALMDKIHRTCTPSTDPTRLAIADAIARHLGVDYPALHRSRHPRRDGGHGVGTG